MKYLDILGLEHLVTEIKAKFVQKVTGKDLSSNDFTNLLKQKLDGIEAGADTNKIELIKKNGANLSIAGDKSVDITVPTKLSDLSNDLTYQTKAEIQTLISTEGKLKKEVVESLPDVETADTNTLYLVPNTPSPGHTEYLAINGAWEMIGDTGEIDLTGYVKTVDLVAITNTEIDGFMNA